MKIERVNENQIRCTLSSFDLSVRNLNLGELAYGTEKARNLFREMIQKASKPYPARQQKFSSPAAYARNWQT